MAQNPARSLTQDSSGIHPVFKKSNLRSLDVASAPVIETREVYLDSLTGVDPELMAVLEAECSTDDPVIEFREVYLDSLDGLDPDVRAILESECAAEASDAALQTLSVEVGFTSDNNFFADLSMDVSEGGLFVTTYQPIPIGTNVLLSFQLPDGHAVLTPGMVVFLIDEGEADDPPPGMGVAFTDLSASDLAAIQTFCKRRAPTYYDLD